MGWLSFSGHYLYCYFFAAFCASCAQNPAASAKLHFRPESMGSFSFNFMRLKSALHCSISFLKTSRIIMKTRLDVKLKFFNKILLAILIESDIITRLTQQNKLPGTDLSTRTPKMWITLWINNFLSILQQNLRHFMCLLGCALGIRIKLRA